MSSTGRIFVLLFTIFVIHKVQSEGCDSDVCDDLCKKWTMDSGTCVGNECRCKTGKICDFACDKFCDSFDLGLEGECDENGMCICKPKLEPCSAIECQVSCETDPRAIGCLRVEAVGCLDYGPVRTCECLCHTWLNQFNRISPAKAKMLPSKNSFTQKFIPKKSIHRKFYSVAALP